MNYDKIISDKFRALAITNSAQFVMGKTYYGNASSRRKFVAKEILSYNEWQLKLHLKIKIPDTENYILHCQGNINIFLRDNNIEDSYGPWLIFDSEEVRDACLRELKIEYNDDDSS